MEVPEEPVASDCCNSGCNPCIFDIYEKKLKELSNKKTISTKSYCQTSILKQTKYTSFKLISIECITQSVNLYTFEFPNLEENSTLKFLPGQYFILKGENNRELSQQNIFSRPYTPIICTYNNVKSLRNVKCNNKLFFQVAVKLEPYGAMSNFYKKLSIGDLTMWRGPYGNFDYKKISQCYKFSHLICFTQGIGLAPIFCIVDSILADETDETIIILNSCFHDIESIILRKEIYELNQFWNFKSNIYLAHPTQCGCHSSSCNCFIKYGETIYKHRMKENDIKSIFTQTLLCDMYILICGNESFCIEIENILLDLQVSKTYIHIF